MSNVLETNLGTLSGISHYMTYKDGSLKSCKFDTENRFDTAVGEIIPLYKPAEFGERQKRDRRSLTFHKNGNIKSASLDQPQSLQTPIGTFTAEAVTFHEDGALNRLFHLNGQIDGYWSEKNEGDLAQVFDFDLPVGQFSAKIICLNFYPSGALKSLTLWPGQKIIIKTPLGDMSVRTGFALYESGALKSVEPAIPTDLITPVGIVKAFDPEMLGMNADQNSVQFSEAGKLTSIKTVHTGLRAMESEEDYAEIMIEPMEAPSLIDMAQMRTIPMQIDFDGDFVSIQARANHKYDLNVASIGTFERSQVMKDGCSSCTTCSGCTGGPDCCKN